MGCIPHTRDCTRENSLESGNSEDRTALWKSQNRRLECMGMVPDYRPISEGYWKPTGAAGCK